jgi:hypothetical protein
MPRGEKRAKERAKAKSERDLKVRANTPSRTTLPPAAENILEKQDETARRIYRTGERPEPYSDTTRPAIEKPRKWREGRL